MKVILTILLIILVSGCKTTDTPIAAPVEILNDKDNDIERINQACAGQVFSRIELPNNSVGSLVAIAENAEACLRDTHFSATHPDNQLAMQLQAIVVKSYFKAGDIRSAKIAFTQFRTKFPMQDLVYDDFTSFVDTTTALLQYKQLTSLQLERLNINPVLKAELARQQRWTLQ